MLNVIEYGKDEYDFPALLVLGCFDAIHVGHRELIKKAKLQAKINGLDLGVMLFRDGKGGKAVYSFEERLAILEEFNVKFVLVIDFTDEFKNTTPENFLHAVEDKVNVKAYMSGKDFRFGAKAKGKSSTLKNYAEDEDNGVWYMPVKDVMLDGEKISTTQIKSYLENGDIVKANELLGSEFCVSGEVVKGAGRGAGQLGFPTVNINYPDNKFAVKQGVYKVKSIIGETEYFGIANYGNCPTFGDERIALEVYFEGFSGDLYGETLDIRFLDCIRDIKAFASPEELTAQLSADKALLSADLSAQKLCGAEVATADSVTVNEVSQPVEEITAEDEVSQPAEELEVTPEEFKDLDSGFGDIVEEPVEEIMQTEEILSEIVEEESVSEDSEEASEENIAIEEDAKAEETIEEATEDEQIAEETAQINEAATDEDLEVVGDGFDDIVEESLEEIIEEAAEEVQTDRPIEEQQFEDVFEASEEEQADDVAEVTEEEQNSEESNCEDKID